MKTGADDTDHLCLLKDVWDVEAACMEVCIQHLSFIADRWSSTSLS